VNYYSYNPWHLGDSLLHLHFLRHLAIKHPSHFFIHAVEESHLWQLGEAIEDVANVRLIRLEDQGRYPGARWVNSWKNVGFGPIGRGINVPGFWETHPLRNDFSTFYLELFGILARAMDLESPFNEAADLWFDYPKIKFGRNSQPLLRDHCAPRQGVGPPEFDFLVVNSVPLSRQLPAFREAQYLTPLIDELAERYRVVVTNPLQHRADRPSGSPAIPCTQDYQLSITDIGTLSMHCPYLLMVSTGPSWPTFNVWNRESVKLRLILLDEEQLNLGGNTVQVPCREAARSVLVNRGLL
jgi:hypothetical protein